MSEHRCDGCGRDDGRTRVYQSKGHNYSELWLCQQCAGALGVESDEPLFGPTVGELLGGLVADSTTRSCPNCGTTFKSIRQRGRVGCAECYRVFHDRIQQILVKEGLTENHVGRYPARLDSYKRLLVDREALRQELESALDREDYEAAASLRDRMRLLEDGVDENV